MIDQILAYSFQNPLHVFIASFLVGLGLSLDDGRVPGPIPGLYLAGTIVVGGALFYFLVSEGVSALFSTLAQFIIGTVIVGGVFKLLDIW